jgi:serine/threonine protein kinase
MDDEDDTDSDMSCGSGGGDTISFKPQQQKEDTVTFAKSRQQSDLDDTGASMSSCSSDDQTLDLPSRQQRQPQQQQQQRYSQQATEVPQVAASPRISSCFTFLDPKNMITVNGQPYLKLAVIGRGGSSKVFKVMGTDNEMYALKRIKLHKTDPETVRNYTNEIELLGRLQGSRHIVRMVGSEVNTRKGEILVVMEIGEIDLNCTIHNMWQTDSEKHEISSGSSSSSGGGGGSGSGSGSGSGNGGGSRQDNAMKVNLNFLRLTWQHLLEAVHSIHEERVVHGDLKPANFLFVNGTLKLIDFGIAKTISDNTTNIMRDSQVGTLNYMCPEAILDTSQRESMGYAATSMSGVDPARPCLKLGRASDIWSLGCILYQMAYGRTPFAHLNVIQKLQQIVDPRARIAYPECGHPQLVGVIAACLERDPAKRMTIPELLAHPFLHASPALTCAPLPASALACASCDRSCSCNGSNGSGATFQASEAKVSSLVQQLLEIGWQSAGGRDSGADAGVVGGGGAAQLVAGLAQNDVTNITKAVMAQLQGSSCDGDSQHLIKVAADLGLRPQGGSKQQQGQGQQHNNRKAMGSSLQRELATARASRKQGASTGAKQAAAAAPARKGGPGGRSIASDLKSQISLGQNKLKKTSDSDSSRFMKQKDEASSPAPGDLRGALEKGLLSRFKNIPTSDNTTHGFDQTWTFSDS